jgi:PAT family beta-lactamase induction signal transducer AmpG
MPPAAKFSTWDSLRFAMRSWRTASVGLMSFASGLPLGLVWIAIPDWMRSTGVDLRTVGLLTLVQAPWSFKVLWAPLMDRYVPGFSGRWGRRRGWIALAQVALFVLGLGLAGLGDHPQAVWVVAALALAIAIASASQDIAIDAYAVDVLHPEEQGVASGARIAIYRLAMYLAGGFAISIAARLGWGWVNALLACLYLPLLWVTRKAPEPEVPVASPPTLREAIWEPFLGFLARPRALEILAFVVCYKLADNLSQALLRPFLIDMGYGADDRGFALTTLALFAYPGGALLGGVATTAIGLGRALWIFGFVQIFSNIGYLLVADAGVNRPLMFGAMGFETFTQGLGAGAFSALLLRLTQRRFSATQYALFSSLFGIPRIVSGPIAGYVVDALGWKMFFWLSMVGGLPGLALLARFVPWRVYDPQFEVDETAVERRALPAAAVRRQGVLVGVGALVVAVLSSALFAALKAMRATPPKPFDFLTALGELLRFNDVGAWLTWTGFLAFAAICGVFGAAVVAARGEMRQTRVP